MGKSKRHHRYKLLREAFSPWLVEKVPKNAPRIANYVLDFHTCKRVDPLHGHIRNPSLRCNNENFPSTTFRAVSPKVTALQYYTGNTVIIGAKCSTNSLLIAHHSRLTTAASIRETGDPNWMLGFKDPSISNSVATYSLGYNIDSELFRATLPQNSSYVPRRFAGIKYEGLQRMGTPEGELSETIVVMVFGTGRFNVLGDYTRKQLPFIIEHMKSVTEPFRVEKSRTEGKIPEGMKISQARGEYLDILIKKFQREKKLQQQQQQQPITDRAEGDQWELQDEEVGPLLFDANAHTPAPLQFLSFDDARFKEEDEEFSRLFRDFEEGRVPIGK